MTLAYRSQDSTQTLAEGLAEYYAHNDGLLDPSALDRPARELFSRHDATHVIFGCDTSLHDEVLADVWTLFGSDVGLAEYANYFRVPEARAILSDAGVMRTLAAFVASLPDVVRVVRRARRMKRKWPWSGHRALLERRLCDLRAELGVEVLA